MKHLNGINHADHDKTCNCEECGAPICACLSLCDACAEKACASHLVMTSNNAYDSILLVDGSDRVLSAWTADSQLVHDYAHIPAEDWKECGQWWPEGFDPDSADNSEIADKLRTIAAYGDEVGRDGGMSDQRREFWGL